MLQSTVVDTSLRDLCFLPVTNLQLLLLFLGTVSIICSDVPAAGTAQRLTHSQGPSSPPAQDGNVSSVPFPDRGCGFVCTSERIEFAYCCGAKERMLPPPLYVDRILTRDPTREFNSRDECPTTAQQETWRRINSRGASDLGVHYSGCKRVSYDSLPLWRTIEIHSERINRRTRVGADYIARISAPARKGGGSAQDGRWRASTIDGEWCRPR